MNFLCVYHLLVSRPDLDSSHNLRKNSQGISQKIQKLTKFIGTVHVLVEGGGEISVL